MLLVIGGVLVASLPVARRRLRVRAGRGRVDEIQLLAAVVAALRAGHSLRTAIAVALDSDADFAAAGRLARIGAPITEVGTALAGLPTNGKRIRAALAVLELTGGRAVAVFDRLLARAVGEAELARQRRQLTAQARASASVVAALPVVATVMSSGRQVAALAQSGAIGLTMTVAGVLLQVAGLAVVWRLAR